MLKIQFFLLATAILALSANRADARTLREAADNLDGKLSVTISDVLIDKEYFSNTETGRTKILDLLGQSRYQCSAQIALEAKNLLAEEGRGGLRAHVAEELLKLRGTAAVAEFRSAFPDSMLDHPNVRRALTEIESSFHASSIGGTPLFRLSISTTSVGKAETSFSARPPESTTPILDRAILTALNELSWRATYNPGSFTNCPSLRISFQNFSAEKIAAALRAEGIKMRDALTPGEQRRKLEKELNGRMGDYQKFEPVSRQTNGV